VKVYQVIDRDMAKSLLMGEQSGDLVPCVGIEIDEAGSPIVGSTMTTHWVSADESVTVVDGAKTFKLTANPG
jgi:hypothetical protein